MSHHPGQPIRTDRNDLGHRDPGELVRHGRDLVTPLPESSTATVHHPAPRLASGEPRPFEGRV